MSEQENMQVVQALYDNFNAGDIEAVLDALSEDVAWVLPSIPNIAFTGAKHGKDDVADFFSTMADQQEPQSFEVQGTIAQGDRVVAHGHYVWHVKTTGRGWEGDFSHHWTVEGGKVTRFQEYTDSAAAMAAF